MGKQTGFRPTVDALEGRLVLSNILTHHPMGHLAAAHPASTGDVAQEGDFQGQFGDQGGPDTQGDGEHNDGENNTGGSADGGQDGNLQMLQSTHAAAPVPAALVRETQYLFLQGPVAGSVQNKPSRPDVGATDVLRGSGLVTPLGRVRVDGVLHGTGFIREGHAGGLLRLSNARGSVTLRLVGPAQAGFTAPQSGAYRFVVTGSTGAFAHALGTGSVTLTLGPKVFALAFHGDPNHF
jgi:hypothetical protein